MDPLTLLKKSNENARKFVAGIKDDQWSLPTITQWNVKELLSHLLNINYIAPDILSGISKDEVMTKFGQDFLGDKNPLGAFDEGTKIAVDALSGEGALDKMCHLPFADMPGGGFANIIASENLFHTWDLAHATSQDDTIDPELVNYFYSFYEPQRQMLRESGAFGEKEPEVPEDADLQTKLLALLGRTR